jgi:hypothetical protein
LEFIVGQKDQNYFILFYKKKFCWDGGYMLPDSIWVTHLKTNQSFKHTRH